jgi:hypothetical protein
MWSPSESNLPSPAAPRITAQNAPTNPILTPSLDGSYGIDAPKLSTSRPSH